MAEGELSAVFRALAKETEEAGGKAAESVAKVAEETAERAEANLARVLEADAKAAKELEALGRKVDEPLEGGAPANPVVSVPGPPRGAPNSLEGEKGYDIYDPAVPNRGRRITDYDDVQDGVLWEEKSATWAQDPATWPDKNVTAKLDKYLEARQHTPGYENAPIGLRMTEPGVEPALRTSIEDAVASWKAAHPGVDVRLEFNE